MAGTYFTGLLKWDRPVCMKTSIPGDEEKMNDWVNAILRR